MKQIIILLIKRGKLVEMSETESLRIDSVVTAFWRPVAGLGAFEAQIFVHKQFELRSRPRNLALLRHGNIQTLQFCGPSIDLLNPVGFRFDMVDPQTRGRRRVPFPNAPPKRGRGPSAGTVGDSQWRTNGMGHSADLRSLRETRFQTSDSLEFEGSMLNLLQGYMRPLTPHRTRKLALNQFVGVP